MQLKENEILQLIQDNRVSSTLTKTGLILWASQDNGPESRHKWKFFWGKITNDEKEQIQIAINDYNDRMKKMIAEKQRRIEEKYRKEQAELNIRKIYAYSMAPCFIKDFLTSPKSAEFPEIDEAIVVHQGNETWIIKSWVDSQNKLGIFIRCHYNLKIQNLGNGYWKLLSIKLYE